MLFALYPNLKVPNVSLSLYEHIEHAIISVVLEFPPSDSYRIRVSFESLYGMCSFLSEVSAFITIPSDVRLLLILFASSSCWPETFVFEIY